MFKKKNLQRGNLLFKQGDVPKQVLFLYKGQVSYSYSWKITVENKLSLPLHVNTMAKKTETFVILGAGEMIGEEALFKEAALPYNVKTETECDFYVLDIPKLLNVCHDNKHIKEIMQRKVEAKKEMIKRRMKPYEALINSGNEGGMWKHNDAQNTLPSSLQKMQKKNSSNTLKIKGLEPNKRSYKTREQINKKFNFHEESEEKTNATFLPKLDIILNNTKEKSKRKVHPPSISNVMSGPNSLIKSQICFKARESIPDPKNSNYTKGILLKKNIVVSDFTKAMSSKKLKKKKSLLFSESQSSGTFAHHKRRAMSPNSVRQLKLKQMTETMFGNNNRYGKIIKRLVPLAKSNTKKGQNYDFATIGTQ